MSLALLTSVAGILSAVSGTPETTFSTNTGTGFNSYVTSLALQGDGKIVVGGDFTTINGITSNRIARLNPDGTPDTTFTTNVGTGFNNLVFSMAVQADGKIVVGGSFSAPGGSGQSIARLNSDGTRDTTFTTNIAAGFNGGVFAVAVQADGKIVAAGQFTTLNGAAQNRIARLNADGTPDATFSFNVGGGFNNSVFSVALQQDGSIAVGGLFTTLQGVTSNYIARLFPNGTPDTAFTTNVGAFDGDLRAVAVQADGKIVVGGFFTTLNGVTSNRIARLNPDGTRDTAFTTNLGTGFDAYLLSVAVQSDGKIVAGGAFATLNGATNNHIARLNPDGAPDTTFTDDVGTGFNRTSVRSLAVQVDGKIVVGGDFTTLKSATSNGIARLGATVPAAPTSVTGTPGNADVAVAWTAPATSGGSAITGYQVQIATSAGGTYGNAAGCATNSTATSCAATGLTNGTAYFFKVAAINAVGTGPYSAASSGVTPAATVPGTPTSVTGAAGNAQVTVAWTAPASIGESAITGYRVQVATSAAGSYSNATGCATNSTTASCTATGLTNGTAYFFKVAAINGAGTGAYSAASSGVTPVTVPGVPASVTATAANTQVTVTWTAPANGGSAITGYQVQLGTTSGGPYSNTGCATNSTTASCTATGLTNGEAYFFRVAGINAVGTGAYSAESMAVPGPPATGTPDTTFRTNLGTGFNNGVYSVAMQADGKIVVGGNFTTLNGVASNRVARLNADGTPDTTFTTNVGTGFNDFVFSVAVQADGKIVAGGSFTTLNGASRNRIARFNADGTPDTAFATNVGTGFDNSARSVAVQADGKIVVGGLFTTLNANSSNRVARINANGTPDTAFTTNLGTGFNNQVHSVAVQGDGKIVVGGDFTTMGGVAGNRIARLNADGIPDTTFTTNLGTGSNAAVYSLVVQADGRIVVGGFLTTLNGVGSNRVARLNADGTPDTTFTTNVGTGFNNQVYAAAVQWDGKIAVGGFFTTLNGVISNRIARLNADGTPDTTFTTNVGTGFNNQVNSVAVQADGKIVVGGEFTTLNAVSSNRIARLNAAVPGAPTSVTGAAGNAQVAVAWAAPASIGGSAITGYQVQVATSAGGTYSTAAGCATNSTAASCTATGLTNGAAYFFKVAAINAAGAGPNSIASSGVTPVTVPSAPTSVAGTAGNTQVTVAWSAPASTGGSAITGYQVQVATSAGGTYSNATGCTANSTAASCTTTGLTNGTAYFFRVAGINAVGTGAYSTESSSVTPATVPGVTTIAPARGPTAGGTTVTLTGTDFLSSGTTVAIGGSAATSVSVVSSTSLTANTPAGVAGAATVTVTTLGGSASLADGFTYVVSLFTDDPLQAGLTPIKAVHITELRQCIDDLRARYPSLPAFVWTDPTFVSTTTVAKAVHLTELRAALHDAYVATGRTPPAYTEAPIVAGSSVITLVNIAEIRAAIVVLW